MSEPLRLEISVAGHTGHVFASRERTGGSAPAVVLIHGIGASHRYLRRLHRLLAASMETYSIDLPGFGATPRPGNTLSVAAHARYILGAMEQLGVPEFVLVGHSMGTQFATEAALQEPGRISNLILMGPVVDPRRGTVAQQALALGRNSLLYESASSNALVFTDYLRCGPVWYSKTLRVMMEYPLEQKITGVSAPGPRGARRQRPRRGCGLEPPAGRSRPPGAAASGAGNRARRPAQPGPRRAGRDSGVHRPWCGSGGAAAGEPGMTALAFPYHG